MNGHHVQHSSSEMLHLLLQGCEADRVRRQGPALDRYMRKLLCLSAFIWQQAMGQPTGVHAAFKQYGIEAVTLRFAQAGKVTHASGKSVHANVWKSSVVIAPVPAVLICGLTAKHSGRSRPCGQASFTMLAACRRPMRCLM